MFRDESILPAMCHVNMADVGNMFLKYMNVYSSLPGLWNQSWSGKEFWVELELELGSVKMYHL